MDDGAAGGTRADRPGRELDDAIEGCAAAHQRLLADLDSLEDAEVGRPSLLPGWSVGHVLTHLARNADSQRHVLEAAARGEPAERYPGGSQQRTGDIEAGAGRPAAALVEDVRRTIWQLEAAWPAVPAEGWELVGTSLGRPEPVAELPFYRWREVEVHHADLGRPSFAYDDWSAGYVRRELARQEMGWAARRPMGLTGLPAAALGSRRRGVWRGCSAARRWTVWSQQEDGSRSHVAAGRELD